ncbi:thioredoxin [Bacteroides pyogenes F0041]|uniref:Thioredoxin n=2 Tax=Bacteroides pyogenes TaxID=310300 RepID=U2CAZ7_9BACE|nr:thioredoxin [Bacteroides pyogenes F0041]GAE20928.1 putative disulphide-isomerase [Bacteroides pyogenes JCM 10003]SUV31646.1 disulfide-isomerase [Bacteroides pyogenes]
MRMKRKSLFTFLLFLLWLPWGDIKAQNEAEAGKGILFHDNTNWESILQLATKENKMIFMDCYTEWCGPCKALAKNVFTQLQVGDFFNPRFINIKYDMEKGEGKLLYARYKKYIVGFPTLLLLDAKGNVLHQLAGYHDADKLIQAVRQASEGKDLFSMQQRYREGERSFAFIRDYMEVLKSAFLKDSLMAVATDYLQQIDLKELDKGEVWDLLGEYITDVHTPAFAYLVQNANRFYFRLHRDYYKINRQIEAAVGQEMKRLTRISFDPYGTPRTLVADTVMERKVIGYMQRAGLRCIDEAKAKFFIKNLLIRGRYSEAWQYVQTCADMELTGFTSTTVNDYVRYILPSVKEKKLLQSFLQTLNEYRHKEENTPLFNYHLLQTLSSLYERLGNKANAHELRSKYEEMDTRKRKEYEWLLQKKRD